MRHTIPGDRGIYFANGKWVATDEGYKLVGPRGGTLITIESAKDTGRPGPGWYYRLRGQSRWSLAKTATEARNQAEEAFQARREAACKKHVWKWCSRCGEEEEQRCKKCGKHRTVKLSKKQAAKHRRELKQMLSPKPEHNIHRVYHKFVHLFGDGLFKPWVATGYELMKKVSRWAKHYPDDVHILSCDDNHHCGSDLVLIEHKPQKPIKGKYEWFGITVVYIPQCSGEDPIQFFLYPGHQNGLERKLREIRLKVRKFKGWDERL
jgi:hypothetical protein